jgi:hypothetical protein
MKMKLFKVECENIHGICTMLISAYTEWSAVTMCSTIILSAQITKITEISLDEEAVIADFRRSRNDGGKYS